MGNRWFHAGHPVSSEIFVIVDHPKDKHNEWEFER